MRAAVGYAVLLGKVPTLQEKDPSRDLHLDLLGAHHISLITEWVVDVTLHDVS
jgi:hypothetical protein